MVGSNRLVLGSVEFNEVIKVGGIQNTQSFFQIFLLLSLASFVNFSIFLEEVLFLLLLLASFVISAVFVIIVILVGPLPLSALMKNCYCCCYRLLHLLFSLNLLFR